MKTKLIRFTAWLLTAVMLLSLLPVTALTVTAEDAGASTVTEIVTEVETMPAPEPDVSEPAVGTVVVEPGAEYVYIYQGKFFLCLKNTSESAVTLVGEFDENGYSISADSVLKLAAGQTVVVQRCHGELDAPEVQYESAYTAATACELGIGKSSMLPWLVSGNLTVDPGVYLFLQNVYMKNETSEPITVTPAGAKITISDDGSIIFGAGYMESQWTRYWGGTATFYAVNPHIKSSNNRPFIKIDAGDKVKTQQMRPQDPEAFAELSAGKNDCIFSNNSNSSETRYTIYTDLAIDGVLFTNVTEDTPITTIKVIWRGENHFSFSGATGILIRVSIPAEQVITINDREYNGGESGRALLMNRNGTEIVRVTYVVDCSGMDFFNKTVVNHEVNNEGMIQLNPCEQEFSALAFTGWNTAADGSGTMYAAHDEIPATDDLVLYAQWESTCDHQHTVFQNNKENGNHQLFCKDCETVISEEDHCDFVAAVVGQNFRERCGKCNAVVGSVTLRPAGEYYADGEIKTVELVNTTHVPDPEIVYCCPDGCKTVGEHTAMITIGDWSRRLRFEILEQLPLSITISDAVKTYGDADPAFAYEVIGLEEGDEVEIRIIRTPGEDVGTYAITAEVISKSGKYAVTVVPATLTVTPRVIDLVWTNTKLEFNGTRQAPTASVGNLVEGDECKITVKGKEMYDGTFTARATAVSNSNYVLPENTTCEFVIWSDSVKVAQEAMGDLIDLIPDSVKDTVEEAVTTAIEDAVSELSSAVTNALEEAVNDLWSRFMSRFGNVFG